MKYKTVYLLFTLVLFFLSSCTADHAYDYSQIDTNFLYKESQKLMMKHKDLEFNVDVTNFREIKYYNFKSVSITPEGVYFRLGDSWVEEYGIFVPRESALIIPGKAALMLMKKGGDPKFEELSNSVYKYYIKG